MCINCFPATRTAVALTWAVPVDILSLGPSLAAYEKVKPAINQLRLCNRFGTGSNVHISRLPQELLDMVIDIIVAAEKPHYNLEWAQAKSCHDGTCHTLDHFDEDTLDEFRDEAVEAVMEERAFSENDTEFEPLDLDELDEEVMEFVVEIAAEHESRWEICSDWKYRWSEMVALSNPEQICESGKVHKFDKYNELLQKDFGLQVFIAKQTIPMRLARLNPLGGWRTNAQRATIAWLTLPCKKTVQDISESDSYDEFEFEYGMTNAINVSNIVDPATLIITDAQRQRFNRALKFLDLQPKILPIQVIDDADKDGPILTRQQKTDGLAVHQAYELERRIDARAKEVEKSDWPKLLNLVSVANEYNP